MQQESNGTVQRQQHLHISKIILYDETRVPQINLPGLVKFIAEVVGIIPQKGELVPDVKNLLLQKVPRWDVHPAASTIDTIQTPHIDTRVCYDGIKLCNAWTSLIPEYDRMPHTLHIIFTSKLFGTQDDTDNRYHSRAVICSNPAMISTTGIVEAPAKPKEWYLEQITKDRFHAMISGAKGSGYTKDKQKDDTVKKTSLAASSWNTKKYSKMYMVYNDKRLGEAIKGYTLQAILYYATGEAFCKDKDCRVYNAHWQKELLHTQIVSKRICPKHRQVLEGICLKNA